MNGATWIVLAVLAAALVLALRSIRKQGPSCGGDCSRCAGHCGHKEREK
ncbi:MAG: FeoB-associated Cys-rich membrane protein [Oscillospiraceae bacterium]|nr:FeoB-associated Cys-rich membrane protein [Oscillospiraceae bacterium]